MRLLSTLRGSFITTKIAANIVTVTEEQDPSKMSVVAAQREGGLAEEQSPSNDKDASTGKAEAIRLHIPQRYLVLPSIAALTGLSIGALRGARTASWRFLAENAHHPPTTVRGWYFYKKTKNYRVMMEALREGGKSATKLGIAVLGYAALEDGMERVGLEDVREVGAAVGTAVLFSAIYRLPWVSARRVVVLGLGVGATMSGLRWGQDRLKDEVGVGTSV